MTERRDPLNDELTEMFGRREGDVLAPMRMLEGTRRKVRRRQSASVAGATLVAIALAGAVTFGGAALLRGPDGSAPAGTPTVPPPSYEPGQELAWRDVDGAITATGNDLELPWTLRAGDLSGTEGPQLLFTIGDVGELERNFVPSSGSMTIGDLPGGGAYVLAITDTATNALGVQLETDPRVASPRIEGRWMPATNILGRDARVWIVFLPGQGSGVLTAFGPAPSKSDGTPHAISWPPGADAFQGQVVQGGSFADGLSWATRLYGLDTGHPCLAFRVLAGAPDHHACMSFPAPDIDDHLVWAVRGGDALQGFVIAVVREARPATLHLAQEGDDLDATCDPIPDGNGVPEGWQACVLPVEGGSGRTTAEFTDRQGQVFLTSRFDVIWTPDGLTVTQVRDAPV